MGRKLLIVLGNGFTIDFLNHINKKDLIDVVNLFRLGANVPWPASGMPGFLSFKHCPHLWNLGARPNMDASEAMSLIEDIITCVNVYASKNKEPFISHEYQPNDIYIYAYHELLQYLRCLFIYYNKKINSIPDNLDDWAWLQFLKDAYNNEYYSEINIITYNYDVFLERTLEKFEVPFELEGFSSFPSHSKLKIIKPHGSISFLHNQVIDKVSYDIKYDRDFRDGKLTDFNIGYSELDENYLITALIPPAGESSRMNLSWAKTLREKVIKHADELCEDDELLVCGISYWHVDRAELDEIFTHCHPLVDLTMVNPKPQRTLNAVLTSMFSNFMSYSNAEILKDKMLCQNS